MDSNPFISDLNNDPRFDKMRVKSDGAGVKSFKIHIDNKNITQTLQVNVLICGYQYINLASSGDLSGGYLGSYRLYDSDSTYD